MEFIINIILAITYLIIRIMIFIINIIKFIIYLPMSIVCGIIVSIYECILFRKIQKSQKDGEEYTLSEQRDYAPSNILEPQNHAQELFEKGEKFFYKAII